MIYPHAFMYTELHTAFRNSFGLGGSEPRYSCPIHFAPGDNDHAQNGEEGVLWFTMISVTVKVGDGITDPTLHGQGLKDFRLRIV